MEHAPSHCVLMGAYGLQLSFGEAESFGEGESFEERQRSIGVWLEQALVFSWTRRVAR